MSSDEKKKPTTMQAQLQAVMQTKVLGRDLRFRIKSRPEKNVIELLCAQCGHDFHLRECKENYFFNCPLCKTIGNFPGVLAAEVDRECAGADKQKEKQERLEAIREKFPVPEAVVPPAPQIRKQSS